MTNGIEAALAALSSDPALTGSVGPDAALAVWSADGTRVLWTSPSADPFRTAIVGAEGRLSLSPDVSRRLRDLAGGLAPRVGLRLARLPFLPGRPSTVACRLIQVGGRDALLTVFMNGAPVAGPAPAAAAPESRIRGILRFTWSMDRDTRFRSVSPSLADVVGDAADVVGRSWSDLVGATLVDPRGVIAAHLSAKATWSDETVFWRIGSGDRFAPVDLGGMPVFGRARDFDGFRGFGFCFADEARSLDEILAEAPRLEPASSASRTLPDPASGADPAPENRPADAPPSARPALSVAERGALQEIARALGGSDGADDGDVAWTPRHDEAPAPPPGAGLGRILDRLPVGILVLRGDAALYANRCFLDLVGFASVGEIGASGGASRLFADRPERTLPIDRGAAAAALVTREGSRRAAEVRLTAVEWNGAAASLILARSLVEASEDETLPVLRLEVERERRARRDLDRILRLAGLPAAILDRSGRILSLTPGAEALFGSTANEVTGESVTALLAAESHHAAASLLTGARPESDAELEVVGRLRDGSHRPVGLRLERIDDHPDGVRAVVFRDRSAELKLFAEVAASRREASSARAGRTEVLARLSHEIRNPLNAVVGFAEIMLEGRAGLVSGERQRGYLENIRASGQEVLERVNDLLDLSAIDSDPPDLPVASLDLNAIVADRMRALQPAAGRARIVLRSRFAAGLPSVAAHRASLERIALTMVAEAVRRTPAGGQVIVSTGVTDAGAVVLRVRDGAPGTPEPSSDPLRPLGPGGSAGNGRGLALPLAKALTELLGGTFRQTGVAAHGMLAEAAFRQARPPAT